MIATTRHGRGWRGAAGFVAGGLLIRWINGYWLASVIDVGFFQPTIFDGYESVTVRARSLRAAA